MRPGSIARRVAQVFAFILQALRVEPPPLSWHDKAASLDTWAVEYDVLSRILETVCRQPRFSPYKPQRWKGFKRAPILTRSRCQQLNNNAGRPGDDDTDDDEGESASPSPTPNRSRRSGVKAATSAGLGKTRG